MESKRMHALVHGRVQGVFFREYTRRQAVELGLVGWVRNLPGGSVETEFQGRLEQVKSMLNWLSTGSPLSLVTGVDSREIQSSIGGQEFEIRF